MYQLRWYQEEACNAAWDYLCSDQGSNPVIVLPTGAGKSLVIAELCRKAVCEFNGRVIVLAHRKELLVQNSEKIASLLPSEITLGIYSAGLNSRATDSHVICGGIQSVYKHSASLGSRQLVIIDEAHLVPHEGEGRYQTFLRELRNINSRMRIIGLTATPFRTAEGDLCGPNNIFQGVCYEADIVRLIDEGYLCRITNKPSQTKVDLESIKVRAGEFVAVDMERIFGNVVVDACNEIAAATSDRQSVLIFCSGVNHAEAVRKTLSQITGQPVGCVTGDTLAISRASQLADFKARRLKYLCNCDVLTTGFDAPCIDAIAVLRATMSPGLFAQIVGRGLRMFPDKSNCLVLDFGGNVKRHGPIDSKDYGKKRKRNEAGEVVEEESENDDLVIEQEDEQKTCPVCENACGIKEKTCPDCGWIFPDNSKPRHEGKHDESSEILEGLAEPKWFDVIGVNMVRHAGKEGKQDTLRVDYEVDSDEVLGWRKVNGRPQPYNVISEWICIEHDGWAGKKAREWWMKRCRKMPLDLDDAVELFERGAVATASRIRTKRDGKFWRVLAYDLDEVPETWDTSEIGDSDPFEESNEEPAPF